MWFWKTKRIPLYHLWNFFRLQMHYTTIDCKVQTTLASLHTLSYCWKWLWWNCEICEELADLKYWFYNYADCSYPAHPSCILGKYPNRMFGVAYKFECHPHPLIFIEEAKDHPECDCCGYPCKELIYQCAQCNFNRHYDCV